MEILKRGDLLVLEVIVDDDFYYVENFKQKIQRNEVVKLFHTFHLHNSILIEQETIDYFEHYYFNIAQLNESGYYIIDKRVFDIQNTFLFDESIEIDQDYFVAPNSISILKHIDQLINHDVVIGENLSEDMFNIPEIEYENLLKTFPTTYELKKYRQKRVSDSIQDYVNLKIDVSQTYYNYLNKKLLNHKNTTLTKLFDYEENKYKIIYEKLALMLENEQNYSEQDWQNEIIKIILIIYPKYLAVSEKIYFKTRNGKRKFLDLCLVDFSGKIDILEIKKPYRIPIFSKTKYRENFFPSKEISGTIMQLEKYIYHLNKLSQQQINNIKDKHFKSFDFELDMINPKGFIIAGRTSDFNREQLEDFEIIKRKYSNIIDFISYDDLLNRIKAILEKFEKL
ncbi:MULTISPECIES: Shedu immune nuclease family protein [Chryseobacterium]|uniref:Shedu immune nuclease family protein n=1 Tax=Chryseobacterium TaxID=59732 RepID=UPI00162648A8|nr:MULTISPECIES: Shedu immune nuclease family protein [Chryseobacterium]MDM1552997.1 DUF4263 domain-containing protein [Chryseobacterium indologenes]